MNMAHKLLGLVVLGGSIALAQTAPSTAPVESQATATSTVPATLSEEERKDGFRLLFDGTSTKGWRQLGGKTFPAGWDVSEGSLHHKPSGGGGDITPDEEFESFELRFDFKVAPNANSGVKYRVVEVPNNHAALGIEYQVVDALSTTADNKGKHALASLYDLVPAKVAAPKKAGEWNQAKIIVNGNHFEHWLNGIKEAELDFGTDAWKTAFAASKWATSNPKFAAEPKGHIIIQDHTDEAWYRNIRIKVLKKE